MFVSRKVYDPQDLFEIHGNAQEEHFLRIDFVDGHPSIYGYPSWDNYPNPWPLRLSMRDLPAEIDLQLQLVRTSIAIKLRGRGGEDLVEMINRPDNTPFIMHLGEDMEPLLIYRAFRDMWFGDKDAVVLPRVRRFVPVEPHEVRG